MTHTIQRPGALRPLTLALALAGAAVPALYAAPAQAAAVAKARCQVHAIHLTKEGSGEIPSNLKFLEAELRDDQFAAYKGFRLLQSRKLDLAQDKKAQATFKSGHHLGLTLLGAKDRRLRLRAGLTNRSGDKTLVDTTYAIEDGGVFMLGGASFQGGRLLFAIRCRSAT